MRKLFAVFEDQEFNQKLASLVIPIALQQFMLAVVSASDRVYHVFDHYGTSGER